MYVVQAMTGLVVLWFLWLTFYYMYFLQNGKEGMTDSPPSSYQPIPKTGIPNGYYHIIVNGKDMMTPIPYGYVATPDNNNIIPKTQKSIYDSSAQKFQLGVNSYTTDSNGKLVSVSGSPALFSTTNGGTADPSGNIRYDPNSYDTQYHDNTDTIMSRNPDLSFNSYYALDACGNTVLITKSMNQANSTYNVPGSYTYGPTSYVPNYEDSVFLSKSTRQPSYMELKDTAAMQGGFCKQYADFPQNLEQACNATDLNQCASTSCCVLLGGNKCVAGNEKGPLLKSNYSDKFVQDPTYYYFDGKCFGNCAAGV